MSIITFNKNDWSGETAAIEVCDDKFSFNGYRFEIRDFDTVKGVDPKYDFYTVDFYCDGEKFASAFRFEGDEDWEYENEGLSRSHENPAVLCAIIAANII